MRESGLDGIADRELRLAMGHEAKALLGVDEDHEIRCGGRERGNGCPVHHGRRMHDAATGGEVILDPLGPAARDRSSA